MKGTEAEIDLVAAQVVAPLVMASRRLSRDDLRCALLRALAEIIVGLGITGDEVVAMARRDVEMSAPQKAATAPAPPVKTPRARKRP